MQLSECKQCLVHALPYGGSNLRAAVVNVFVYVGIPHFAVVVRCKRSNAHCGNVRIGTAPDKAPTTVGKLSPKKSNDDVAPVVVCLIGHGVHFAVQRNQRPDVSVYSLSAKYSLPVAVNAVVSTVGNQVDVTVVARTPRIAGASRQRKRNTMPFRSLGFTQFVIGIVFFRHVIVYRSLVPVKIV